jgi:hypothetical protein
LGFYLDGRPRGWTLDIEPEQVVARRLIERGEADGGAFANGEEWVGKMVATIYRDAEAEHRLCLFRGKSAAEVAAWIVGPDQYTYICDESVRTCSGIVGA